MSMDDEIEKYSQYLLTKLTSSRYIPNLKFSEQYNNFIRYYEIKGIHIDELFLKCIRNNNMIMFRRMIMNPRVDTSYQNNEALIICVIDKKYKMLSMLLEHPYVSPYDQNNLALRLAISKKDKTSLDLLLNKQSVIDHIYNDPELLSYVWIYQNNGNIIL